MKSIDIYIPSPKYKLTTRLPQDAVRRSHEHNPERIKRLGAQAIRHLADASSTGGQEDQAAQAGSR